MAKKYISRSIDVVCTRGSFKGCKTILIVVKETPKLLYTQPNPNLQIKHHTESEKKKGLIIWCKETKARRYESPLGNMSVYKITNVVKDEVEVKSKRTKVDTSVQEKEVEASAPTVSPKNVGMFNAFKRQMQSRKM